VLTGALWIWVQRVFGLDVLTLKTLEGIFSNWLKGRGGGILIP